MEKFGGNAGLIMAAFRRVAEISTWCCMNVTTKSRLKIPFPVAGC